MAKRISEELKGELHIIRETALQIRDEMSHPTMKARIDRALTALAEIPLLFDTEEAIRTALKLPNARIRAVVQSRDQHGPDAQEIGVPGTFVKEPNPR